jgi:histidinol-phosphate aminotransferase
MPIPWNDALLPEAAIAGFLTAVAAGAVGGFVGGSLVGRSGALISREDGRRLVRADRRAALVGGLARLPGVRTWPAVANFVLVRVPDGPSVLEHLGRERIAVRPCGTFPGLDDNHLRIAVRRPEATERLLAALKRALGALQ